jgi:hypothetical protein
VLTADPGTGVMRHADAGYEGVVACAREQGLRVRGLEGAAWGLPSSSWLLLLAATAAVA